MPGPRTEKSRRLDQCCYIEGGRRCRRSGTGDPALCNPHKVIMVDAAKQGARPRGVKAAGDGIYDFVERLVSGKKVTRKVAKEAWNDARDILRELEESGWTMPNFTIPSMEPRGGTRPNGHKRPPPDPEAIRRAQNQQAVARARQTLGFGPQDRIDPEIIKKRQRELAKKHHPDRGGSLAKMQEINAAVDVLMSSLVRY